jgi:hypothetical protein
MSKFVQHSFPVEVSPESFKRPFIFAADAHPFVNGHRSLSVVNQHGLVKIYGLVDTHQEMRVARFLIIGTNHEVPEEIIDRVHLVGPVLLADGRFGHHVYYIDDYQENHSSARPSTVKASSVTFGLQSSAANAADEKLLSSIYELCNKHRGRIVLVPEPGHLMAFTLRVLDPMFNEEPEFADLMDKLYDEPAVEWVRVNKAV